MSKYTKKQRNALYKKALGIFADLKVSKKWPDPYACYVVAKATGSYENYRANGCLDSELVVKDFPELELFSIRDKRGLRLTWWANEPFDYDNRETALLFMIEMSKN
jgi:hypothetical protein